MERQDSTPDPFADYFEDAHYEEVSGLGDRAAFGVRPNGSTRVLLVISDFGDKDRRIELLVDPLAEPTVEQARPIAERVLDQLDG